LLGICLKNRNSAAARNFGREQLSPASRWPSQANSRFSDRL
jgi:hypothetical protein